jgi:hypothetical protein
MVNPVRGLWTWLLNITVYILTDYHPTNYKAPCRVKCKNWSNDQLGANFSVKGLINFANAYLVYFMSKWTTSHLHSEITIRANHMITPIDEQRHKFIITQQNQLYSKQTKSAVLLLYNR